MNDYWAWNSIQSDIEEDYNSEKLVNKIDYQNFDTYKELKKAAKLENPDITKEEIYEKLLKPYRHEKVKIWDEENNKFKVSYICRSSGWNKQFKKIWNMLDHMRMHKEIKPYKWSFWRKSFTQKGNLQKHLQVQHSAKTLEERKKV